MTQDAKLKIYYIANARMPTEKAHGIQTAKMCEALIEQGADVELVVPRRGKETRSMKDFYGLRVDVPIKRIRTPDWYGSGRIGFWASSVFFMYRYRRYIRAECHVPRAGTRAIAWAIDIDQFSFAFVPFLGIPYIAEIHDAKKWTVPFYLLFRRARGVIVINRIIERELKETFKLKDGCILVLPNGVDLAMFKSQEDISDARAALGISRDRPIVMYVGRIYAWKGLDVLVAAARKRPDFDFYIVGGTAEELRAVGAMDDQPKNLICVGARPFQEIPRWMRAANVLIATGTNKNSYSFLHTSPMKLFEYMAAGRPIIAARTPAIEEIFMYRNDGIVFYEPDDVNDFIDSIKMQMASDNLERDYQEKYQYQWLYRAEQALKFIKDRL